MQERFCSCGARIMVQFTNIETKWQPVFWSPRQARGTRLHVCPSCGQYLEINRLS